MMDKSVPIDVVLHLNYVPQEADPMEGWNPSEVEAWVREELAGAFRRAGGLELESIETLEPPVHFFSTREVLHGP